MGNKLHKIHTIYDLVIYAYERINGKFENQILSRYFEFAPHYRGEITFLLREVLLCNLTAVIFRKISERRFCRYLADHGKFSDLLIRELWDLFHNAEDEVKKVIFMRYFFDLGVKVHSILRGQDEMGEEINFLEYLLLDHTEQQEE